MNCFFCFGILARLRVYILLFSSLLFSILYWVAKRYTKILLSAFRHQKGQSLLTVLFLIFFIVFTSHVTVYNIKHKYIFKQHFVTDLFFCSLQVLSYIIFHVVINIKLHLSSCILFYSIYILFCVFFLYIFNNIPRLHIQKHTYII